MGGWVGVVIYYACTRRPAAQRREASGRWNRGRWAGDRAAGRNPDRFQIQLGRAACVNTAECTEIPPASGATWCAGIGRMGTRLTLIRIFLCLGPRRLQWPPAFSLPFGLVIIIKGLHFSCRPYVGVVILFGMTPEIQFVRFSVEISIYYTPLIPNDNIFCFFLDTYLKQPI